MGVDFKQDINFLKSEAQDRKMYWDVLKREYLGRYGKEGQAGYWVWERERARKEDGGSVYVHVLLDIDPI